MTSLNAVFGYVLTLFLSMLTIFAVHIFLHSLKDIPLFEYRITLSYTVNFLLAIFIFIGIYLLKKKYLHILGFLFMGGSMLKFTVFFILFYPFYNRDDLITTGETLSFLIPYLVSLFIETFYLSRVLNSQE